MEFDILEKSRGYMREGHFEKAQVILRRFLHDNPDSAKALELSGDLAQKQGKKEEALAHYEQAVEYSVGKNEYLQAIICLEKITKLEKTSSDRYVRLAHLYKQFGLPNQGIQKIIDLCSWAVENKDETTFITGLRKIVELQPENLRLALSYVQTLKSMNRVEQAEKELKRLKTLATEQGDQVILEEINKLLPQTDGGEEELDPKSRVELGNLLYEIGSKDEAIVEFNKAVSDLVEQGDTGEAIKVLNRIVEIDPGNELAENQLRELQGEVAGDKETGGITDKETGEKETETIETEKEAEPVAEVPVEEPVAEAAQPVEAAESTEAEPDLSKPAEDIFDDLIREVETYVEGAEGEKEKAPPVKGAEESQTLEGQIADIEFLLKEMEAPPAPAFEVANVFDDFRGHIVWQEEDVNKRLELARRAFDAELYETALNHARELKINKNTWPLSLELTGAAMIKLGQYSEAIRTVGPAILLEDIPQSEKLEMRYLLASAYEGLGDFENALREIEHIMSTNPDYKDVKEMYELLGGEGAPAKVVEEQPSIQPAPVTEEPVAEEVRTVEEPEPVKEKEETYPREIEQEPIVEEESERLPDETGENISFL
jgi:tetratricopeptide (TPR) repeat protein